MGSDTLDALAATHELIERGAVRLAVRRDWLDDLPVQALLDDLPLERWGRSLPDHGLRGRGPVHVLQTGRGQLVAKRLGRGGLLGRWLPDRYVDGERSFREALLAERLLAAGLATPALVVVRAVRQGRLHRLETASERLTGACDLEAALRRADLAGTLRLARAVGRQLRALHEAGLEHRDLQVKNILVPPDGPPWILDLDGCRLHPGGLPRELALAGLARLGRSLVKRGLLRPRWRGLPAAPVRAFWCGYGALGGGSRASGLALVGRQLRGQLRRHAPRWWLARLARGG